MAVYGCGPLTGRNASLYLAHLGFCLWLILTFVSLTEKETSK
uniref:Uncharacterized protein n=1 Tax=Anguilla anguilla TaxID=7936 RepID=A0A0E9WAZ1_ANGAN